MTTTQTAPIDSTTGAIATWRTTVLDCPDPMVLAGFYSTLTGWEMNAESDGHWAELVSPLGVTLAFQRVETYQQPEWPSAEHPQQLHADFDVDDLDDAEQAVLAIGAVKAAHQPGTSFRVFLDPANHPFCLCRSH